MQEFYFSYKRGILSKQIIQPINIGNYPIHCTLNLTSEVQKWFYFIVSVYLRPVFTSRLEYIGENDEK